MDKSLWMWAVFIGVIVVLLILDLGVFQKKDHKTISKNLKIFQHRHIGESRNLIASRTYKIPAFAGMTQNRVFRGDHKIEKFPASTSLGITVTILSSCILYSLYKTRDSSVVAQKAFSL